MSQQDEPLPLPLPISNFFAIWGDDDDTANPHPSTTTGVNSDDIDS